MSNFPCSPTRNITSHSIKHLAFHTLLRWKMIKYYQFSQPHLHNFPLKGRGNVLFELKGNYFHRIVLNFNQMLFVRRQGFSQNRFLATSALFSEFPFACDSAFSYSTDCLHWQQQEGWQREDSLLPCLRARRVPFLAHNPEMWWVLQESFQWRGYSIPLHSDHVGCGLRDTQQAHIQAPGKVPLIEEYMKDYQPTLFGFHLSKRSISLEKMPCGSGDLLYAYAWQL